VAKPAGTTKKTTKAPAARGKAPAGKTPAKQVAKRAAAPAPKAKAAAITAPMTKAQLLNALSDRTGLAKKDVTAVVGELQSVIEGHLAKKGPGQFTLPGLLKIARVKKPATKARVGRNPRTGEPMEISAKPARTTVRVRVLKGLKGMI
jgi:nucleoid DNA-binding protein